jgi:hypothetical protein
MGVLMYVPLDRALGTDQGEGLSRKALSTNPVAYSATHAAKCMDGMASGVCVCFSGKQSGGAGAIGVKHLSLELISSELQAKDGNDLLGGCRRSRGEMKMKMRNLTLFGMVLASMAAYGEPINLGCSARGPLAALNGSVAFREAIGAANPANFLGSVYDVNGQQLSPETAKALQCPLFIDSTASPSASMSKAILSAQASARTGKAEEQTAAPAESKTVTVLAASGVVLQFPQPEMADTKEAETQAEPQTKTQADQHAKPPATSKAESSRNPNGRVVMTASVAGPESERLRSAASKLGQELKAIAAEVPTPKLVEEVRERSASAVESQKSWVLSLAQAILLVRQVGTRGSEAALEFNPLMALLDFVALFGAIFAFCLLVFYPRLATAAVQRRTDLYRSALASSDSDGVLKVSGWMPPQSNAAAGRSYAQTGTSNQKIPAQVA